ncbi:hypothetical protein N2W54_006123 [Lotmaria passim]
MSARWPSSLLNSTNRQLTERIEQLSADLESKRSTVAELREVVALLKKDQQQTRKRERTVAEALTSKREALEKDEGRLKHLGFEIDANARRARGLQEEETRLMSAVAAMEAAMGHKRHRLEEEQKMTLELEAEVKEIVLANLARQREGEELSAAQREFSSTIWAKLERLNEQLSASTRLLADARAEHSHVLRKLDAVQHSLHDAVREQSDGVRALELVHAQSSQLDTRVVTNATAMEALMRAAGEKAELRERLRSSLDRCLADNKRCVTARDRHRRRYDRQLHTLRQLVESIRDEEAHLVGCTSRQHAEEHLLEQQRRELDRITLLCEERTALLALEKARHVALSEARTLLDKQASAGAPSPAALHDLVLSLTRHRDLLEDRLERAQLRLTWAIQAFEQEGRKADEINEALGEVQKKRRTLAESQETTESEAHLLKQRCTQLGELLGDRRALLPSIQALAQEQRAQRQESWAREVEQLRATLQGAQREYQQLLQGVTTLRSSLLRTRKVLENGETSQSTTIHELRLLEGEVGRLEQEQAITTATQRRAASQVEQASVTLQSMMKTADAQVGVLKEAAGAESFLRAEVQIQEDRIQAEVQNSLVKLHLHEGELHELNEELQRHKKKLGLLRMRYEEVMASLARASQKPLNDEHSDASLPLPPLDPVAATTNPEAVHAHLLLRRSFEREQLMQRGNYLDLRLVTLGRETSTLRHMLDSMRTPSTASPLSEATVCVDGAAADEPTAFLTENHNRTGTLASVERRGLPLANNAPLLCGASAVTKDQLIDRELAQERYWKLELDLLDEAMGAMTRERDRARAQQNELHSTLKELQSTAKQKQMRLQKLHDAVERSHRKANTAAIRGVK